MTESKYGDESYDIFDQMLDTNTRGLRDLARSQDATITRWRGWAEQVMAGTMTEGAAVIAILDDPKHEQP